MENIEQVELTEDNVEWVSKCNVHVNCPKCGLEHVELDIELEKDVICECYKCGHKFKFYVEWLPK